MLDLFGEIVITNDDINAWVSAVAPGFFIDERRRAWYVRTWNVVDKVARAKRDGTFDATIENARARRASLARRFGFRP
ncbi:hypothetical protein [Trinickia symbiotica]|uniref:Uncharacterized protein n=1 Tax=Trinickia symbiotica TaxID=863227 RepID=A0A2N7XA31_9BURK|nr:hypothetical protein [Trinickia symbiotica]PMS38467.1 hypothetical protein C0Z20_00855 [Trinickia symbiotica]